MYMEIENALKIKEKVSNAARLVGKKADEITIIAVTKTVEAERILKVKQAGIDIIGENKAQELNEKYEALKDTFVCHFIGHLQTNKVKQIVDKVSMIQSVDSLKLCEEINKQCIKINKIMDILIEVNVGNELNKSGIEYEKTEEFLIKASEFSNIKVRGLMAIPPICNDKEKIKEYFTKMNAKFIDIKGKNIDNISMDYLSMGMSNDFEEAIICGANMVRIGSLMFGKRNYAVN